VLGVVKKIERSYPEMPGMERAKFTTSLSAEKTDLCSRAGIRGSQENQLRTGDFGSRGLVTACAKLESVFVEQETEDDELSVKDFLPASRS